MFHVPNENRIIKGPMASTNEYGNNGAFHLSPSPKRQYMCIASDGGGWEHVSIEVWITKGKGYITRTPTWDEMCYIKSVFWDDEDTVIQFHPPKSEYVNIKENVLHLWRNIDGHKLPPLEFV